MHIYQIENLCKRYADDATWVNQGIDLTISQGEIFGLLGSNGAGKSTLVKQMVALLKPTSGSLHFLGQDIEQVSAEIPLLVGYMPQETHALNTLTVAEALYFTAHLRGLSRAAAQTERDRLIDQWQLEDIRNKPSTQLSGGQRRLLRLAVAMAGEPPVLILDEPTNDLDPQRRKLVWDILRQTNQANGTTIIFITHDAIEAEKIIQRVGIMQAGKLIALGKPSELKKSISQKLRLDLFFDPNYSPQLPAHITPQVVQAGQWQLLLQWDEVAGVMAGLNSAEIHDLRLITTTLEDLYLHYVA